MRSILLLAIAGVLAGCVSANVREFAAPDGTKGKTVKCNSDVQKCFAAASESCGSGTYQVISSESHAGGLLADVLPGPVTWYGMTYVCGSSDGKMPSFTYQGQSYSPPPQPAPVTIVNQPAPNRMKTTNCTTIGNNVNCTAF